MSLANELLKEIINRTARVGVVGIGYVGSNLAEAIGRAGFETIGLGRNPDKVAKFAARGLAHVKASTDKSILRESEVICICVPTPLTKRKKPDLSAIISATEMITEYLRPGQLVILESSVAPGTTRTIVLPILEKSGLVAGKDFFLGYSPERVDPGNKIYPAHKIPKVISGKDPETLQLMRHFYTQIVAGITEVSSIETAELTKVFENVFRFVNISLVNELSHLTQKLGLDTYEVIMAAATKPFGFMPHFPSPGIGGDCIPVMPRYYLSAAKKAGVNMPIVKAAISIDRKQSRLVVERAQKILATGIKNGTPRVFLLGLGYKKDIGDLRESAGLTIWKRLLAKKMEVFYHDPYVPKANGSTSTPITNEFLSTVDLVIIATNHSNVPYDDLMRTRVPILDTRHTFDGLTAEHIHKFS